VTKAVGTSARWWQAPTLAYLRPDDAFIHALCTFGIISAIGLIIGVLPMLMTAILWTTYLSLAVVGQTFLSFQWDALLLEAGFLAILWSPPLWAGPKSRHEPSRIVHFLFRWLLFRLMFLSALTKWIAGDECWRDMTALRYHFETQPLPTWTSWYAHHSPNWMLSLSCIIMFFIEFVVPFFYFAPRRTKLLAFWLTVLLQINIMATGNYGFFNILTIVLAFTLLDDAALAWIFRIREIAPRPIHPRRPILRYIAVWPIAIGLLIVTTMTFVDTWPQGPVAWPRWMAAMERYSAPFRSINSYGLFRVMTKDRPEIAIEGSDDLATWKEYPFKYKMGDVNRRPGFVIGHMPRLDWQMWFAALGPYQQRGWLTNLSFRLLHGQKEVLDLLEANPFPDRPPQYVRAVMYDYRFSERGSSDWWVRKPVRVILGPVELPRETPTERSFRL
jgi:hypothetical protein